MSPVQHLFPLGFNGQLFPPGSHICQIYSDDDERLDSLLGFLESGLKNQEKAACFTNKLSEADLFSFLKDRGLRPEKIKNDRALIFSGTDETYFENGSFEPERMLGLLRGFYDDSVSEGFRAARVIGEMVPAIHRVPGGERLMEYESRVSLQMRTHPLTVVCQYDANTFDGATIMQVLKVHPLMVIRGAVVHNPYFIPPEQYLRQLHAH